MEGKVINILNIASHKVSVTSVQSCRFHTKALKRQYVKESAWVCPNKTLFVALKFEFLEFHVLQNIILIF